jgi:hypothetical protein
MLDVISTCPRFSFVLEPVRPSPARQRVRVIWDR